MLEVNKQLKKYETPGATRELGKAGRCCPVINTQTSGMMLSCINNTRQPGVTSLLVLRLWCHQNQTCHVVKRRRRKINQTCWDSEARKGNWAGHHLLPDVQFVSSFTFYFNTVFNRFYTLFIQTCFYRARLTRIKDFQSLKEDVNENEEETWKRCLLQRQAAGGSPPWSFPNNDSKPPQPHRRLDFSHADIMHSSTPWRDRAAEPERPVAVRAEALNPFSLSHDPVCCFYEWREGKLETTTIICILFWIGLHSDRRRLLISPSADQLGWLLH